MQTTEPDQPPSARGREGWPAAALTVGGVVLLLAANLFLRRNLEHSGRFIYSFLSYFYPDAEKVLFAPGYPVWKLFLPMTDVTGSWTTTTLVLTHWVELRLTPPVTWYLFNALMIVSSFLTSWLVFRSRVFSFTFAICIGFGTQLYHTYAVPGALSLCLLFIYFEVLLLAAVKVITRAPRGALWKSLFVTSALVTALAYESWLDMLVFAWGATVLIALVSWRWHRREWWPGLTFCAGTLTLVGVVYLYIKTHYGYVQTNGMESDVVFNYPMLAPAVEDVVSNVIANLYVVVTNFAPPWLMTSMSFYELGGDRLVELQHNYHAAFSYLVPMQAMFFWRYLAGMVFAAFCYLYGRVLLRLYRRYSDAMTIAAILLLMVVTGGPTHAMVKARPFHSMPLLAYHVPVGVLGMSLLIAFLLMLAWQRLRRATALVVVIATWTVIFYGVLARPAVLAHEASQVGLGQFLYPDPMASLAQVFGRTTEVAPGMDTFRLARVQSAKQPAMREVGGELPLLPGVPPPLTGWEAAAGVTVTPADGGFRVDGNDSSWGYQLTSPPIAVGAHRQVLLHLKGGIKEGAVCFGVLSGDGLQWVVPADGSKAEHLFDTGTNATVRLVIANCYTKEKGNPRTRFTVESISYAFLSAPGVAPSEAQR